MLRRVGATKPVVLLVFLIAIDLTLLVLHVLHVREASRLPWVASLHFRISTDQGFAELFQYLKLMLIIGLLWVLWSRHRYRIAGIWAAVFTVILIDDALMLHERLGIMLASTQAIPVPPGMSGHEVGELLVWAFFGVTVGLPLLVGHVLAPKELRRFSQGLFFLLGTLVFFSIGMDTVHNLVTRKYLADALLELDMNTISHLAVAVTQLLHRDAPISGVLVSAGVVFPALASLLTPVGTAVQEALRLDLIFTLLEDGGEMIVVSIAATYCWWVMRTRQVLRVQK